MIIKGVVRRIKWDLPRSCEGDEPWSSPCGLVRLCVLLQGPSPSFSACSTKGLSSRDCIMGLLALWFPVGRRHLHGGDTSRKLRGGRDWGFIPSAPFWVTGWQWVCFSVEGHSSCWWPPVSPRATAPCGFWRPLHPLAWSTLRVVIAPKH